MIRNYAEFIEKLVKSFTSSEEFTWGQFGTLMLQSVQLVGLMLFATVGMYFLLYKGPGVVYGAMTAPLLQKLNNTASSKESEISLIEDKLLRRKALFWLLFVIAYIPLLIPVVLMLINIIF